MSVPITELILHVPNLREQQDVSLIKETLSNAPGIGLVEPDYLTQWVRVTTANSDKGVDVVRRLSEAAFPVDEFHRRSENERSIMDPEFEAALP
jgi:hypothetical protein